METCSFLPLDGSAGLCSGQWCFLCGLLQRRLHSGTGRHLQLQGGCTSNASFLVNCITLLFDLIISSCNPYKPYFVFLLTWMTCQLISDPSYTLNPYNRLQRTKQLHKYMKGPVLTIVSSLCFSFWLFTPHVVRSLLFNNENIWLITPYRLIQMLQWILGGNVYGIENLNRISGDTINWYWLNILSWYLEIWVAKGLLVFKSLGSVQF